MSDRTSVSELITPVKLVPWSIRSFFQGPLMQKKRRKAFIMEEVSSDGKGSMCVALETKQVKITAQHFLVPQERRVVAPSTTE